MDENLDIYLLEILSQEKWDKLRNEFKLRHWGQTCLWFHSHYSGIEISKPLSDSDSRMISGFRFDSAEEKMRFMLTWC